MDIFELAMLMFSVYYTFKGLNEWYKKLPMYGPFTNTKTSKYVLSLLPVFALFIILFTLKFLASFDVVNDFFYILFYVFLGYAWTFIGMKLVFRNFDLSWIDDVSNLNNKAALFAVSGAFLGIVTIYSGANIGDGPGFLCVIFAGGLGMISWILLGKLLNSFTQIFERITIERDIYCGIRFGAYLLASGLILARASAGDWTSVYSTIVEFLVGWPVLLLTALAIIIERYYIRKAQSSESLNNNYMFGSLYWGSAYIAIAVISLMIFPLVENPMYDSVAVNLLGVVL